MEAQGDKMGAVTLRHEIDGLLASAKGSLLIWLLFIEFTNA